MQDEAKALTEVVVVGYGVQKRKKVTNHKKVIENASMDNLTVLSPQQMLQGKLPVFKLFSHQEFLEEQLLLKLEVMLLLQLVVDHYM
jgi:hypothetical protein